MPPAISLQQLSFSYRTQAVLQDITLEIPHQSLLALIGPNGSGKTTLLRVMSKALRPQHGTVLFDGQPLVTFSARKLAQKLAVISSEQHFEFPFSVADVVAMGRFPHLNRLERMSDRDWKIVDEAMERTSVLDFRNRSISQLSSGEKQRVLIARAIAQQPSILMLDEPNAHLDINHQIAIFNLLRTLNRQHQMTVIVVLHDLSAAAAFCETMVLLHRGQIVRTGTPAEVITAELIQTDLRRRSSRFPEPGRRVPADCFRPCARSRLLKESNLFGYACRYNLVATISAQFALIVGFSQVRSNQFENAHDCRGERVNRGYLLNEWVHW